jgi:purine-binding chemotaxis protein CheW
MPLKKKKRELTDDKEDEIQLVSFKLGDEIFAVRVDQVREIGRVDQITKVPKMPDFIEGVMNLRGQITTIIDLRRRFEIDDQEERTNQARIIVAEIGDIQLGIIVDSVQDVIRISTKSLSPPPKAFTTKVDGRFLSGICKQPESLIMLIDLSNILDHDEFNKISELTDDVREIQEVS